MNILKKIYQFFKENWIGAVIGCLVVVITYLMYFQVNCYSWYCRLLDVIVIFLYSFAFLLEYIINGIVYRTGIYQYLIFVYILIIWSFIGAIIQRYIGQKKKNDLIVILTIFAVGLFSFSIYYYFDTAPQSHPPNRCTILPEFQCLDYLMSRTENMFVIRAKNNVGEPITVERITLNSETDLPLVCITPPSFPILEWKAGDTKEFKWSNCNFKAIDFKKRKWGKIFGTIKYYPVYNGSNYAKEIPFEVLSRII